MDIQHWIFLFPLSLINIELGWHPILTAVINLPTGSITSWAKFGLFFLGIFSNEVAYITFPLAVIDTLITVGVTIGTYFDFPDTRSIEIRILLMILNILWSVIRIRNSVDLILTFLIWYLQSGEIIYQHLKMEKVKLANVRKRSNVLRVRRRETNRV